ncbi:MAG: hypothetical protein R3A10_18425 [Caldilineaceae bacterium]
MDAFDAYFTAADVDFILAWSGGQLGMLDGVCRVLSTALAQDDARSGPGRPA